MQVWKIPDKYIFRTIKENLENVRRKMEGTKLITSNPEEIAWLLNIRGNSGDYNLGVISHLVITNDDCVLYIDETNVSEEALKYLTTNSIIIKKYTDFNNDFSNVDIPTHSIISYIKSVKNEKEIQSMIDVYKKDEKIVDEFIEYVKTIDFSKEHWTEKMLMDELDNRRKNTDGFVSLSFYTIMAYKESAATIHYEVPVDKEKDISKTIKNEGFLLIDSGAHYLGGTTDMTKMVKLGKLTEDEELHFQLVKEAQEKLANTKFKKGTYGFELDLISRNVIKEKGIDFKHGVGHGVGYMLSVHETPPTITHKRKDEKGLWGDSIIEANQIVSIEPGIYIENSHGIRIEYLYYVKDCGNDFLEFKCLNGK